MGRIGAVVVALVLLATACSSAEDEASSTTTSAATDGTATDGTATDTDTGDEDPGPEARATVRDVPDTPAGRRFEALLTGALTGTLAESDVESALAPAFLDVVSASSFVSMSATLPALLGASPVVSETTVATDHAFWGTLVNPDDASRWSFAISVEVGEPHRVIQYVIAPDQTPEADASLADVPAAAEAFVALAPDADFLVARISDGADPAVACTERVDGRTGAGTPLAIGSAFKLWVLAAVATAVEDGTLAWTDEVTITDGLKSLPSGQLQTEEDGSTVSVATAAALMMGVSDNTATDLLIDVVGRSAVEAELEATGHHDPDRNRPMLTTREVFLLKLGDAERLERFRLAAEDERREILAALVDEPLPSPEAVAGFTTPTAIDVEWFATAEDLCRVIVDLDGRAAADPTLAAALRAGRGPVGGRAWPTVAFKGGSEPGVLNLTWLVEAVDGSRYVVTGTLNDAEDVVDVEAVVTIVRRVFDLLAEGGG